MKGKKKWEQKKYLKRYWPRHSKTDKRHQTADSRGLQNSTRMNSEKTTLRHITVRLLK